MFSFMEALDCCYLSPKCSHERREGGPEMEGGQEIEGG